MFCIIVKRYNNKAKVVTLIIYTFRGRIIHLILSLFNLIYNLPTTVGKSTNQTNQTNRIDTQNGSRAMIGYDW